MAHPKRKISKQRRDKRRTHIKLQTPVVAVDSTTGESHQFHRAHYTEDGALYYKGNLVIEAATEEEEEDE